MFFSKYEYQPIYIISYNLLRCRKGMSHGGILDIIKEDGYEGLKSKLDVEEVSKLAIEAIETYLMKVNSIDFNRLINDYMDDNLDYFMDLGLMVGSNYIEIEEVDNALLDVICYFHNNYIYKNVNLDFEFVNKSKLYEDLSEIDRENEFLILNPILSAIGSMYSIGKVDYENKEFNLKEKLKTKLDEHIKTLSKESLDEVYYENNYDEYQDISREYAEELGLIYEVKDNEITITGYKGNDETLYIPNTIDDVPVRYLEECCDLKITKLVVLANLKKVKRFSLSYCYSLKQVDVIGSLGLVGQSIFHKTKVPSVTFAGVTYLTINNNPCYLLTRYQDFLPRVYVERRCKSIAEAAFFGTNVESVSAPSVEYIGEKAFGQCKNLKAIQLNKWLKGIGEYAFYICESLMSIKIDARVLPPYLFYKCSSLRNISIGKGVEEIGLYSLSNCDALKSITIPSSVHKLGQLIFEYTPIEEVRFEKEYYWKGKDDYGEEITLTPEMQSNPNVNAKFLKKHDEFDFEVDLTTSIVENMTKEEAEAYGFVLDYNENEGTYRIEDWTKDEKVLVIPKSIDNIEVTTIGAYFDDGSFGNKEKLERLIILGNVKFYGSDMFVNCKNLKEISVPTSIQFFPIIFQNCPKITTIESEVTYIKMNNNPYYFAMNVNENSKTIFFSQKTEVLGSALFFKNTIIENIYLPDVKFIPESFAYKAEKLRAIMIPDTVQEIKSGAFGCCYSLEEAIFLGEEELKTIGYSVFEKCVKLRKVVIPRCVENIGNCCFENCINLERVYLPYRLTNLGRKAFYNCLSLKEVEVFNSNWICQDDDDKIYLSENYYSNTELAAEHFTRLYEYNFTKYVGDENEFKALVDSTSSRKRLKLAKGMIEYRKKLQEAIEGTFDYS